MIRLKGKSISFTCVQLFTAVKIQHCRTLEKEKGRRGGAAAVSPHSAACIMLRSIRLHTFLNSNLLLHCLRDSQNNNKFAVLSIDALGVGFSL